MTKDQVRRVLSDAGWITREIETFIDRARFNSAASDPRFVLLIKNNEYRLYRRVD